MNLEWNCCWNWTLRKERADWSSFSCMFSRTEDQKGANLLPKHFWLFSQIWAQKGMTFFPMFCQFSEIENRKEWRYLTIFSYILENEPSKEHTCCSIFFSDMRRERYELIARFLAITRNFRPERNELTSIVANFP